MNNDSSERPVSGPKNKNRKIFQGRLRRTYHVDDTKLDEFLHDLKRYVARRDKVVQRGYNAPTNSDVIHALVALAEAQPDGILTAIKHVKDDVGYLNVIRVKDKETDEWKYVNKGIPTN